MLVSRVEGGRGYYDKNFLEKKKVKTNVEIIRGMCPEVRRCTPNDRIYIWLRFALCYREQKLTTIQEGCQSRKSSKCDRSKKKNGIIGTGNQSRPSGRPSGKEKESRERGTFRR